MPVLSDAALDRLAGWIVKKVLKDTCEILRKTQVQVASGGFNTTYPVVYSDIPCAVMGGGSPQESFISGQEVGFIPKMILLPKGQDVLGTDRIRVNGTVVYHVIDPIDPTSYEVVRRVQTRRASMTG
jgi:hypothetical protein